MRIKTSGKAPYMHTPPTPPQGSRPPKLTVSNLMKDGIIYEVYGFVWHMRHGWMLRVNVYYTDNRLSPHGIDQTSLSTFTQEQWDELSGNHND